MLEKIDQQIADNERALLQLRSNSEVQRRENLAILYDLSTRLESKSATYRQCDD
jgi:hypothetical protein